MAVSTQNLLNNPCLGVVLAGGLSTRMGSNKAELQRNKQSMLDFSAEQLTKAQVSNVVISGKKFGLADNIDNIGPLGGIFTVIEKYRPQALLVMPVDLPLIDHHCLAKLKQLGELTGQACYYQDNFLPLYIPVTGYLESFMVQQLSRNFNQGSNNHARDNRQATTKGPSMKQLLASIPSRSVIAERPKQLFNANTPDEWQQAHSAFTC